MATTRKSATQMGNTPGIVDERRDHQVRIRDPIQQGAGEDAHRKQAQLNQRDAAYRYPDAYPDAVIVPERIEAGDLARIHQQLQRAGQGDPQQHHKRQPRIQGEQMFRVGCGCEHRKCLQATRGLEHPVEDRGGAENHQHALHHVRAHHRHESADRSVEHHDHQRQAHRMLIWDTQKTLEQVAGAFEYGDQVEQARQQDHHRRRPAAALCCEPRTWLPDSRAA